MLPTNTTFHLVCVCLLLITCQPLLAQEQQLIVDYATPIKHIPVTLGAEHEAERLETFRHRNSKVWDDNPNYILKAFGQLLHLVLRPESSFVNKETFGAFKDFDNHTKEKELPIEDYVGCFYSGHVKGDNQSAVAVSLCHGMTGHIKTSFGLLLIQPANNQTDLKTSDILHEIWRPTLKHGVAIPNTNFDILHEIWRPTLKHGVAIPNTNFAKMEISSGPQLRRRIKRNSYPGSLTIELVVAMDPSIREFHGNNTESYVLTLVSMTSNVYAHATIGNKINISLKMLIEFDEKQRTDRYAMADICNRLRKNGYHFDAAIYLTRDQICDVGGCHTLGYATLGGMCTQYNCAIVRDSGLKTAFTMAHELGHMLNMPHDDDAKCTALGQRKLHTMSSAARNDANNFSWSTCSRHYFSQFVQNYGAKCLENTPSRIIRSGETRQPGEIYTLDQQCELINGKYSKYYPTYSNDCQILYCTIGTKGMVNSNGDKWADGTPCKGNRNWCKSGACVRRQ